MGKIISFVSVKGGVGKTTISLETAVCLANEFGKRVLLIDGNISAPNVGLYLDLTHKTSLQDVLKGTSFQNAVYESYNVDVIPAALNNYDKTDILRLKKIVEGIKNRYDFIIIDSSPHYSEMVPIVAAAEMIFVVTTPDSVTLNTSLKAAKLARQNGTPIEGVIVNRIRDSAYEMNCEEIEWLSGLPVIGKVKEEKKMVQCVFYKKPLILQKPHAQTSEEIRRICQALVGERERRNWFVEKFLKNSENAMRKEQVNREVLRKKISFND